MSAAIDDIVIVRNIPSTLIASTIWCRSTGKAHIGYYPVEGRSGPVKTWRGSTMFFARRMQNAEENLTAQHYDGHRLMPCQPRGVAVLLESGALCALSLARGCSEHGVSTITTQFKGVFSGMTRTKHKPAS